MRTGNYLDWPAVPAEERCCVRFDKGKSLTDGLAGRMDLETAPWSGRIELNTDCQPKD